MNTHFRALAWGTLFTTALLPGLLGCGKATPTKTVSEVREAPAADLKPAAPMPSAERMGMKPKDAAPAGGPFSGGAPMAGGGVSAPADMPAVSWDTPKGWSGHPSTPMRVANFSIDAIPGAECYLTVLGGGGGGTAANVNRWRKQMGLAEASEAEIAALPKKPMLGQEAEYVVLDGTYTGMGAQPLPNARLYGAALTLDGFAYFAKLTGPADKIGAEETNFLAFCASLKKSGGTPGAQAAAPLAAPPAAAAAPGTHPPMPEAPAGGTATTLKWTAPEAWKQGPDRMMRTVTFNVGQTECYISELGGTGGGIAMNLNRWRGQMGQEPLSAEAIAALPKIEVLGVPASLIEIDGDFTAMDGGVKKEQRMLGVACALPEQAIFIKMVGPAAEVQAEHDRFVAFCQSLKK